MPEHVTQVEQPHAGLAAERLPVAAEVRDVVHAGLQALVLGLGDVAAARIFEPPEILAERHLLLVGDLLVVEHEHGVTVHARLDRRDLVRCQRFRDLDARHLTHEHRMDLADG